MPRTIEYWRPTNGLYHATPPGIAVLTQDSDWEVLNEATGFYEESPYPSAFKGQVYRALNYINATPTGASLLWNLYTTNNSSTSPPRRWATMSSPPISPWRSIRSPEKSS
ncbi:hypothetical protein [Pseudomonas aeruginosa]|uniref:hypothetical protein n=1 Tax=Pseudomonas aeruginosa TaxID=287 RepID=UPI00148E1CAF|nr:hypothetical protein [Pseudomonas aeruginosa]